MKVAIPIGRGNHKTRDAYCLRVVVKIAVKWPILADVLLGSPTRDARFAPYVCVPN